MTRIPQSLAIRVTAGSGVHRLIPGWFPTLWRRKPRFDFARGQVADSTPLLGSVCLQSWLVNPDAWGTADQLLPRSRGKTQWVKPNLRCALSAADLVRPLVLYSEFFCWCNNPA